MYKQVQNNLLIQGKFLIIGLLPLISSMLGEQAEIWSHACMYNTLVKDVNEVHCSSAGYDRNKSTFCLRN